MGSSPLRCVRTHLWPTVACGRPASRRAGSARPGRSHASPTAPDGGDGWGGLATDDGEGAVGMERRGRRWGVVRIMVDI